MRYGLASLVGLASLAVGGDLRKTSAASLCEYMNICVYDRVSVRVYESMNVRVYEYMHIYLLMYLSISQELSAYEYCGGMLRDDEVCLGGMRHSAEF